MDAPTERESGEVKWFDMAKGYGFIRRANGSDIFVHYTQVIEPAGTLRDGDKVTFVVGPGRKGEAAHQVIVVVEEE